MSGIADFLKQVLALGVPRLVGGKMIGPDGSKYAALPADVNGNPIVSTMIDAATGQAVGLSHSPSRTLWSAPAPSGLAPSGSVGANGALTLGTSIGPIFISGLWLYFPAGAVFAGSAAGFYWCVMTSNVAGVVYNTTTTSTLTYPTTLTPIVDPGPGAFTGVTGAFDLASFAIPNGLLVPGDSLDLFFNVNHSNNANTKSYSLKVGGSGITSPNWTTTDGWSVKAEMYINGANQFSYPQGWQPTSDVLYGTSAVIFGTGKTITLTATRNVATDFIVLHGMRCVYFPAA